MAVHSPDSLQDLCTFYCMNNLNIVVSSLNSTTCDDAVSSFPMQLGNKLLHYYMRCGIPNEESQPYLDQLLQNDQLCNEVTVTRRGLLTADNILELANNPVKCLKLAFFEDDTSDETEHAKQRVIENNLENLIDVCLYQKCTEDHIEKILCLMCGKESLDIDSDDGCDTSDIDGDTSDNDKCGHNDHSSDREVANTKFNTFQIDSLDTANLFVVSESGDQAALGDSVKKKVCKLKSFAYQHINSDIHPNLNPGRYLFWMYERFTEILNNCPSIQTFSLVTMISNPIEWFLCQPDVGCLQNLQSLTLSVSYGSVMDSSDPLRLPYTEQFFVNLPLLKQLRHLDVSVGGTADEINEELYTDRQVEQFIQAVKDMSQLRSLDIAGTNLHKIISHKHGQNSQCSGHCMAGFEGRRFEYIGVFQSGDAARHKFIPADKVSGEMSEEQLLVALWSYQHNRSIMEEVLDHLTSHVQENEVDVTPGLSFYDGLVQYLEQIGDWDGNYMEDEKEIYSVLHCLYYVLKKGDTKRALTVKQKRNLLERLMVLFYVIEYQVSWRSGNTNTRNKIVRVSVLLIMVLELEAIALNLKTFKLRCLHNNSDNVYSYRYEQYIDVLLGIFNGRCNQACKLLTLRLLHSACRVSQEYKAIAGGKMNLVKRLLMHMLDHVVNFDSCDVILEKVWSIMWTLTDEVPSNCELFVKHGGCQVVKACLEKYGDKTLHRKITGAMNNVSENFELHDSLMTQDLIDLFRRLLVYDIPEDFDGCAHVVGFLMMLASTGQEHWRLINPTWETILAELEAIIMKWDIKMIKGVKFRSLGPMLRQIENRQCSTAQLWGAWEICNLLQVRPDTYCPMFEEEDGMPVVNRTLLQENLRDAVRDLLNSIDSHFNRWKVAQQQI